jgi:hypothetical protein
VVTPVRKERTEEIADLVFGLARDAGASPPGSPQSAKHAMLAEVALVLKGYPDFLLRMGPGDFLEKRGVWWSVNFCCSSSVAPSGCFGQAVM